jgi:hypothetical protein
MCDSLTLNKIVARLQTSAKWSASLPIGLTVPVYATGQVFQTSIENLGGHPCPDTWGRMRCVQCLCRMLGINRGR